jgi:hypothetical protein
MIGGPKGPKFSLQTTEQFFIRKFCFPYQSGRIRVRMEARIVVHLSARARRQHIQRRHVHEARRAAEHVESEMLETAFDGIGFVPAKERDILRKKRKRKI